MYRDSALLDLSQNSPDSCQPALIPEDARRVMECAHVAQSVEHVLGKDGVAGSIPAVGSVGIQVTLIHAT